MKKLFPIHAAILFSIALWAQKSDAQGIAQKYPLDNNIESHPSVIFASGFENGFEEWDRYNPKVSEILG